MLGFVRLLILAGAAISSHVSRGRSHSLSLAHTLSRSTRALSLARLLAPVPPGGGSRHLLSPWPSAEEVYEFVLVHVQKLLEVDASERELSERPSLWCVRHLFFPCVGVLVSSLGKLAAPVAATPINCLGAPACSFPSRLNPPDSCRKAVLKSAAAAGFLLAAIF